MIILIGNQKGGCGKTTIATNMAAVFACQGKDVILFDADLQISSSEWIVERKLTQPKTPKIHSVRGYDDISDSLDDLNSRYQYVIVDVSGRDSNEFRSALTVADILAIPVKPSQVDLNVLPTISEIVKRSMFINPKLHAFAFINLAPTHSKNLEINESRKAISSSPGIVLLNTVVHDRKCFRDALSDGLGVVEMFGKGDSEVASRLEIESLVMEIFNGN